MEINVIQEIEDPVPMCSRKRTARRSDVWQFMEQGNQPRQVICKLCGLQLTSSSRSGTSNLRNHLINRHCDQYRPLIIPERAKRRYAQCEGDYGEAETSNEVNDGEIVTSTAAATTSGGAQPQLQVQQQPGQDGEGGGSGNGIASGQKATNSNSKKGLLSAAAAVRKKALLSARQQKLQPQANMQSLFKSSKSARHQAITNLIFMMLVEDLLPVHAVEGSGFRTLIQTLQTSYEVPTKFNIEDRLNTKLAEGRSKLGARLTEEQKVGLSCDLWTDYQSRNFITLTAHLITKEWKHESWILGTIKVHASATDEKVAQQMRNLCMQCGLSMTTVTGVVYGTDGKQSVADAMERLRVLKTVCGFLYLECRPCAGELLGISVQNALSVPSVTELIHNAGKLLMHITADANHNAKLSKLLKEHKKSTTLTVCDTSSRWLTILDMFSQLASLQEIIGMVLCDDMEMNLTEAQWKLLHELIQALQGVKAAVAVMADPRNKPASCCLPMMQGVLQHIESPNIEDLSEEGQVFRNTVSMELKSHCELNEILPCSLLMQASAVDPRFHHLRFLSDEDRIPVIDEMTRRLTEICVDLQEPNTNEKEDSPFFALLGEDEFNKKSTKPEDEINLFRLERPVSRETDPLNWWRLNESRFPGLAKLARALLCVPITATPLSQNQDINASLENRKRLDPRHVDAQIFLHKNLGLFL